jgi:hypothetical protein
VTTIDGHEIGMVQCYRFADLPQWDPHVTTVPSASIDYLIGDIWLFPEVGAIVVPPRSENRASCRVLEKAGYGLVEVRPTHEGPASIYVLRRDTSRHGSGGARVRSSRRSGRYTDSGRDG